MTQQRAHTILHVCSSDIALDLRDRILRLHGFEVDSTLSLEEASRMAKTKEYSLILIDVEGDGRIPLAEELCGEIKEHRPDQKIVFICNYIVSSYSNCPDEIIHTEFKPTVMVEGVRTVLEIENDRV